MNEKDSGNQLNRGQVVEKLLKNYKGQFGRYKYYAGQVFVFKQGNKANKTLLIKPRIESNKQGSHSNLLFKNRPVYEDDSIKVLQEIISIWQTEWNWYYKTFGNISGVIIPPETYSICDDPMGSNNKTILVNTPWVNNIKGDIFRIGSQDLFEYLNSSPDFVQTLTTLITHFIELSEKDIYPDFLGTDNVAIYLKKNQPHIALVDPHIIFIGKNCTEPIKSRLKRAKLRFKSFIKNPKDIKNITFLTSNGLM